MDHAVSLALLSALAWDAIFTCLPNQEDITEEMAGFQERLMQSLQEVIDRAVWNPEPLQGPGRSEVMGHA